ncbi:MBL fold metallo-hydrolase [Halocatena marina]|uniref:MBL fold metallo-hydrolase n=1 Tax=Halocatena marina TaxID=2934937 RepID=UPI00200E3B44|nr:MBL fold metallo-hydrolase [Halocatena marina]
MVQSNWGTWFINDEVEAVDPDGLSIWYLGCNGFILRTKSTTVYIDPYFGSGTAPETIRMLPIPMAPTDATMCDAVLVTHEHIDHMHPPSYGPLVETLEADLYAPKAAYDKPDYDGDMLISDDQKHVIEVGDHVTIGDLTVNVREANDPDAIEPVSYVVEHTSGTFFHAGDSRPADAFKDLAREFDIDLGALALGTVGNVYKLDSNTAETTDWYNDENQIIEAANALGLTRLLPSHYDMWKGVGADPKVLHEHARSYEYPRSIEIVEIGDRLEINKSGVIPPTMFQSV